MQRIIRIVQWIVGSLVVAILLIYVGDSLWLDVRVKRGTAYDVIQVRRMLASSLKGNRVAYDPMGTAPETCSHSLFPQHGYTPCWYLEGHRTRWE